MRGLRGVGLGLSIYNYGVIFFWVLVGYILVFCYFKGVGMCRYFGRVLESRFVFLEMIEVVLREDRFSVLVFFYFRIFWELVKCRFRGFIFFESLIE